MIKQKSTGADILPLSSETVAISHLSIPETEPCSKWIRTYFDQELIADTSAALILRRAKRLPVYCFPKTDVRLGLLQKTEKTAAIPPYGTATFWTLTVNSKTAENAAWSFEYPAEGRQFLKDYIVFEWGKMDDWYEEADQVFVHLKDPYHRIDVLNSTSNIRVLAGGKTLADTSRAVFLFETGFPTRYYIPRADVNMEFLHASDLQTRCPYKGIASDYWSINAGDKELENCVWSYANPLPEAFKIKGCLCFFNEKVDEIYMNDTLVPKPVTPWS